MAAEMAQAFQELAKGEQTASALEKQLDGIENRIDELLAAAEASANTSGDDSQGSSGRVNDDTSNGRTKEQ
ncbi:hypothetical protein PMZ80_004394 [Knufia obscura]|nr:hypothetical protein PMZ80_004394 [Knufia obscura]